MENKMKNVLPLKSIIKNITVEKWLLIGGAGIMLILCSDSCGGKGADKKEEIATEIDDNTGTMSLDSEKYVKNLEKKLEELIEDIDGAGDVEVMITVKNSSTKEVLTESAITENKLQETDSNGGRRDSYEATKDENVVLTEEGNSVKSPFIISEATPQVEGVAVIAKGGDSPVVKEKITGIIKALFGIEINKIAVGKMK